MHVTWLGHSTVVLDLAGARLVTDPLLRRRVAALTRRHDLPLTAHVPDVDAVLLSHLHHDHADLPSLRRLAPAPVLTHPENAAWVRDQGLGAPHLDPGEWHRVAAGVEVRLVRAEHHSRPMPHRPNAAAGHLLRTSDLVVWAAGDTSLHPGMDGLADLAGGPVDLAVLPVGGWGPRLSEGHLGPREAAEAARRCGARHVIPVHFGTLHPAGWPRGRLGWTDAPGDLLAEVLPEVSGATLHRLPVGGGVTVPASAPPPPAPTAPPPSRGGG